MRTYHTLYPLSTPSSQKTPDATSGIFFTSENSTTPGLSYACSYRSVIVDPHPPYPLGTASMSELQNIIERHRHVTPGLLALDHTRLAPAPHHLLPSHTCQARRQCPVAFSRRKGRHMELRPRQRPDNAAPSPSLPSQQRFSSPRSPPCRFWALQARSPPARKPPLPWAGACPRPAVRARPPAPATPGHACQHRTSPQALQAPNLRRHRACMDREHNPRADE